MGRQVVGRTRPEDIFGDRHAEVRAWLESLGLDPTRIAMRVAVTQDGDRFELHLTEYLVNENGNKFLDFAAKEPATRPVVVEVADGSWPAWLTGLGLNDPAPQAPPYVHRLVDAFLTGEPLNFGLHPVPVDIQRRLDAARADGTLGTVPV